MGSGVERLASGVHLRVRKGLAGMYVLASWTNIRSSEEKNREPRFLLRGRSMVEETDSDFRS